MVMEGRLPNGWGSITIYAPKRQVLHHPHHYYYYYYLTLMQPKAIQKF